MSFSVSRLFILADTAYTQNKLLVKGLHSAYVEPLRSLLFETLTIQLEQNSSFQLTFTAYDDGSVAFNMLSVESSVFWGNDEYIIKQLNPDYTNGFTTYQVTAIQACYDISKIRQRQVKTGTLTYSVQDVLSFYLDGNSLGYTWRVIGNFDKQQITDLGGDSGKDMLDKIVATWSDAVFYPEKRIVRIYQHDAFAQDLGRRIDYLHDTPEIKLAYDSTNIVNQVMASGKTKDSGSSDKTEYYFDPFIVQDDKSIQEWGLRPGDDVSDERFTNKDAMKTYALSQLTPEPTLSIEVTQSLDAIPKLGEIRRLENRKDGFVTSVEVVGFTHYPLNRKASTVVLNNRAKTILNYKSSQQKALNKAISDAKAQAKAAVNDAKKAFSARIIGTRAETAPFGLRAMTEVDTLPLYTLKVAEDNDDFGLKAGDQFAVQTTASGVEGLDAKIAAGQISYEAATPTSDGLMSSTDKAKLDGITDATQEQSGLMSPADKLKLNKLKQEPVESIDITDSSTGSIYKLTVSNGEINLQESEHNGGF